ncbi:MAG TPA: hypothetical protein VGJ12_05815 [Gemmatimonadaceae bacterium]
MVAYLAADGDAAVAAASGTRRASRARARIALACADIVTGV